MSEAGKFMIYGHRVKHLSERAAYELFCYTGVDEYVRRCYGALHTTGEQYILADIEGFMRSRQ